MQVYRLRADANTFQRLVPLDDDWEVFSEFDGRRLAARWAVPAVEFLREKAADWKKAMGDFPSLATHVPVFSERAVAALAQFLQPNGELLPLRCAEGEYAAYNVTRLVDALDLEHSVVKRFRSGEIMDIERYAFRPETLGGLSIFKLPQTARMDVFVTDPFVE